MVGSTERETQVRFLYGIVTIGNNIFEELQLLKEIKPKIAVLIRLVVRTRLAENLSVEPIIR